MGASRSGDWTLARRLLSGAGNRAKAGISSALAQQAHALRKEVVEGITKQAPGGTPIRPLASTTLAARTLKKFGGTKALIRTGELRNAITVVIDGDEAFIGVLRKARGRGGRSLANVAEIQEFGKGPIVIPITPRMRRYLFVLFKKAGVPRSGGGGRSKGVVVVTIPPRPFLRPAFETFRKGVHEGFLRAVARSLGWGA